MNKKQVIRFFKDLSYKDVEFSIKFEKDGTLKVSGFRNLVDPLTKDINSLTASEYFNYKNCSDFELLNAIRDWIHNIEKHEADECIIYKGKQPYQPHIAKVSTL